MAQQAGSTDQFQAVFARLRSLIEPHTDQLRVIEDSPTMFGVESRKEGVRKKQAYVGGVRMGKRYISYYLMPVYADLSLLEGISPELKRRMQGKSCFNFTGLGDDLVAELDQLTRRGLESYRTASII